MGGKKSRQLQSASEKGQRCNERGGIEIIASRDRTGLIARWGGRDGHHQGNQCRRGEGGGNPMKKKRRTDRGHRDLAWEEKKLSGELLKERIGSEG